MIELPRSLAPWGSYLAVFPRDLALSLGPVLQRLASAVGPLQVRRRDGGGAVDGYDGLDRHGSYERLLATEWLLADEMPDEFLRRAVMGEHLFLHTARPEPGGTRASVAVFDAGPGQLGSPRIAQLAALIVLARRAEAAGARFAWGILQDPEAPLHPEVTESGILRLLQSRTPHEATDAQIGAWRARVQGWKETDDVWIIGPPRLGGVSAARGASVIQVWDVLDPDLRRVAVRVRPGGPGTPPREITLELPDDSVCARLLRDPFASTVNRPRRLDPLLQPVSNLVFASNGARLFARAAGGGVVAFPVPNSPRGEAGPPRAYDPAPGHLPVAVGVFRKRVLVAVCREDGLVLHELHRKGGTSLFAAYAPDPGQPGFLPPEPAAEPPLQPILGTVSQLYVRDASGRLFRLTTPSPQGIGRLELLARTTAASVSAGVLTLVEPAQGEAPARLVHLAEDGEVETLAAIEGTGRRAFFGYGGPLSDPAWGLAAVEDEGTGAWQIFGRHGTWPVTPFAGTQVVGVGRDPQQPGGGPGLLLLEDDWRSLVLAGRSGSRKVATATSEIEHVAVHHASPRFALATASGEVTVGSFEHEAPLFRLLPEEAL
jgi:hypothetical protein